MGHAGETTSLRSQLEPIPPRHRDLYYGGACLCQAPLLTGRMLPL